MHHPGPIFPRLHGTITACALCIVAVCCLASCSGGDVRANLQALFEKQRLVGRLQHSLLLASDAENNALLSPIEADAKAYVATARQALAACTDQLGKLEALVQQGKSAKEIEALNSVSNDFKELAAISVPLLELLGRNTNLRAAQLSRTEASRAVLRLQQTLTPIIDGQNCPASKEASRIITSLLMILTLHPQHIDESTAAGMDTLEAAMEAQNQIAREALTKLGRLLEADAGFAATVRQAQAAYAAFGQLNTAILALSRENTNIEAAALSMGRKQLLQARILSDVAQLTAVIGEKEFTATR